MISTILLTILFIPLLIIAGIVVIVTGFAFELAVEDFFDDVVGPLVERYPGVFAIPALAIIGLFAAAIASKVLS